MDLIIRETDSSEWGKVLSSVQLGPGWATSFSLAFLTFHHSQRILYMGSQWEEDELQYLLGVED